MLVQAFRDFGMPTFDMTAEKFLNYPAFDVFTFGRSLVAIDIITKLKGRNFPKVYAQVTDALVAGLTVWLIYNQHLLQAKRAADRPRNQNGLNNLLNYELIKAGPRIAPASLWYLLNPSGYLPGVILFHQPAGL